MDEIIKKKITKNWFKTLQEVICQEIEELEKNSNLFRITNWEKGNESKEGGGQFRIFENGKIFEKVGVNFSEVYGKFSKEFKNKIPGANKNPKFWASGISVVMHMKNPHVPAMHFNTRYIYTTHGWFGGGIDVTPCIEDKKLEKWFHTELKKSCDKHNKNYYKKYKKWCDNYFYLPHRKETRGIGGIFFDYKKEDWVKDFSFVREVGINFKNLFRHIIMKKNKKKWTKHQKNIQNEKRGRYVEFNLLYDRGTKFGLQTNGNVEAILMSLPPVAKWK
jgi:coproporphyrinogen III oxidase